MKDNKSLKQKGFSLIELLAVLSIFSILLGIALVNFTQYNKNLMNMDVDIYKNSLLSFINSAKQYCREKNKEGTITIDLYRSEMEFRVEGEKIDELITPSRVKLYDTTAAQSKLQIEADGMTASACSIWFKDEKGGLYKISIYVGTAYVEIKE